MLPLHCNLFVYGTLMSPRLMLRVSGRRFAAHSARLHHAKCFLLNGKPYPGLRRDSCGTVEGILYRRVPRRVVKKLDRFEADYYSRQPGWCEVLPEGGCHCPVELYWLRQRYVNRLSSVFWPLNELRTRGIYSRLT